MDRAKVKIKRGQGVKVLERCHPGKEASVKTGDDALPFTDRWKAMSDSLDEFEGDVFADGRNQLTWVEQRESFDRLTHKPGDG